MQIWETQSTAPRHWDPIVPATQLSKFDDVMTQPPEQHWLPSQSAPAPAQVGLGLQMRFRQRPLPLQTVSSLAAWQLPLTQTSHTVQGGVQTTEADGGGVG